MFSLNAWVKPLKEKIGKTVFTIFYNKLMQE